MKMFFKNLKDFLKLNQFEYDLFNSTVNSDWDEIVFKHSILSTHFISSQILYEEQYNKVIKNNSLMICNGKEICVIKLYNSSENFFFGIQFSKNFNFGIGKKILKELTNIFLTCRIQPFFLNNYCSSKLHNYFLYLSSKHFPLKESFEIFVDLRDSEQQLWNGLRKSYRSLINKSKKEFEVIKTHNVNEWENLKKTNKDISEDFILKKIKERLAAKQEGNYKLADQIRDELLKEGVIIEDQKNKTTWKFK